MAYPLRGPLPWLAMALAINVIVIAAAAYALGQDAADAKAIALLALVAVAGATVLAALAWKIVDFALLRSLRRLATDIRAIAHGGQRLDIDQDRYGQLAPIAGWDGSRPT